MSELSELDARRLRAAKNQSLFREVNERIEDLAASAHYSTFICECMNDTCDASVQMTLEEYEQIRSDGNKFFILPGHEVSDVEDIIESNDRYLIVSKVGPGAAVAEQLDPRRREP